MKYLALILLALFFNACGTKREYFTPAMINGDAPISSLGASIKHSTRAGATLSDGSLLTKNGITQINLKGDESFLGEYEGKYIISDLYGNLKILSHQEVIYEHKFPQAIISASLEGNNLALLSAENKIYLIYIDTGEIAIEYASGASFANDSRMAAPIFLNSIIVYPTLDGKVMIVDKNRAIIMRDAVVSSDNFFNNIIFLDVEGDKLYAASATKILMISPEKTAVFNAGIKDITLYNGRLYVSLKDGFIKVLDLELKELIGREFEFAIFSNIIAKHDHLYLFEKTGYIIEIDTQLQNERIYKATPIKNKSFAGKDAFYYDDKMIDLK